jgi:glycoside/pentoside/hexuronide:cation symporter, GPH family
MLAAAYKTMLKNGPFRNATFSYMFTWGGFMVMQAFFMFYLESYMGIRDMWTMLSIVVLLFVAAAGFLPLWLYLMRRIGKKASYNIGMGALALCSLLIMLVQPGHLLFVYILVFLMSFGVSAAHVVPLSILPDTIDISRLQSGYDMEGLFYGFQSFMQKAATAGFTGLAGVALGAAHYIKLEDLQLGQSQPASAILAIRIIFSAIPALFMGIGVIFMFFMKLDRRQHEQNIEALKAKGARENV